MQLSYHASRTSSHLKVSILTRKFSFLFRPETSELLMTHSGFIQNLAQEDCLAVVNLESTRDEEIYVTIKEIINLEKYVKLLSTNKNEIVDMIFLNDIYISDGLIENFARFLRYLKIDTSLLNAYIDPFHE